MECTDMFALCKAIKAVSMHELRKALELLGGSYEWEDTESAPVVIANTDYDGPTDVIIRKVFLSGDVMKLVAEDKETGEVLTYIGFDDIEETHLQYIIEYIDNDAVVSVHSMREYLKTAVESIENLIKYDKEI